MFEPKHYTKYNDLQKTDNLFVLDKFMRLIKWKEQDNVLDVGFGDGKFAVECLLPRFPKPIGKFIGCDISEAMVKYAKTSYKYPKVDFMELDISSESIPIQLEMEFDHIFSFYTLHWVTHQRQAFKNMYRMLKPGGDMLLTYLVRNPVYDIYRSMSDDIKWQSYIKPGCTNPYDGYHEPEKILEKLLIEIGFISHVCRVEKRSFVFPTMEMLQKSVVAVTPIIHQLPTEEVTNYINDAMQHIRKLKNVSFQNENNNEGEAVHVKYQIFVVFASKPLDKC